MERLGDNINQFLEVNMDTIIEFLKNNYDWLLSGVLSSFIFFVLGFFKGKNSVIKQNQKVGDYSRGYQFGGNFNSTEGRNLDE